MTIFLKFHEASIDIGELVSGMYSTYGRGMVSFDTTKFGQNLLNPQMVDVEFDLLELLSKEATYLLAERDKESIEKYDIVPDLNSYDPKRQYVIGVYFVAKRPPPNTGYSIYNSTAIAPLFTKNNPASHMESN